MKTYAEFSFQTDIIGMGSEVKTFASHESIMIQNIIGASWNPETQKEEPTSTVNLIISASDARELAANLLRAADFSDEAAKVQPRRR